MTALDPPLTKKSRGGAEHREGSKAIKSFSIENVHRDNTERACRNADKKEKRKRKKK